ncbi:NDR1/HIN1-like protein 10 [Linum perenne]
MAEPKQTSPLNGAYYGPSIPPQQSYHSHGRRSGCGCCGCLFSCLLKIILTIAVIIGIAILVFWLVVRPNKIKVNLTDATLTQFNHSASDNILRYNLALNVTVRNPNKRIGIYYDSIEARGFYWGQRFGYTGLQPFYQGHKNTSVLSANLQGQNVVVLRGDDLADFNRETIEGVYRVDVTFYMRIRLKVGKIKTRKMKPKVECRMHLNPNGGGLVAGPRNKCKIDF